MELVFNSDTKHRKQYFTGLHFSHPAKMHLSLQLWIIENYTKPSELILDPMAGTGTVLLACMMGRNVIAIELEQKFVDMKKGNWEKIRQRGPMMGYEMGTVEILQGDSRNLEGILADKIITSPPYAEAQSGGGIANMGYQGDKHSPTDLVGRRSYMPDVHGVSVGQIGNLPYGSIDKVITSPPYSQTGVGDWQTGRAEFQAWVISELTTKGYVEWQGKHYTESEWRSMNHGRIDGRTTKGVSKHSTDGYSSSPSNIGNLPHGNINSIITSPPYEGTTGEGKEIGRKGHAVGAFHYGNNEAQIGNLKGDTYLEAMLIVYRQCFKVLRPGGLLILVTKNFIRNKQEVRLDDDTIKLCETAGFIFKERHYRKLKSQSFWRVIYQQKYPDAPVLNKEDILIFSKEDR